MKFILIKKKGSKKFLGAKPIKKGTTTSKIKSIVSKMPKSYSFKIVTEKQLENYLLKKITTQKRKK